MKKKIFYNYIKQEMNKLLKKMSKAALKRKQHKGGIN